MNIITARVETAINLTVTELNAVNQAAAAINFLVEKGYFQSLDTVTEFLRIGLANPINLLGDPAGWHVYQGGHHVALSRIGGTNGETHRVLFVCEGKTPEQAAVILDGIDARVAALIATLAPSEASYAAAYVNAVDAFGLDEALEHIEYSFGLSVSQRAIVRRQVLLARQPAKVTNAQTAPVAAPQAPQATNEPVEEPSPLPAITAATADGSRYYYDVRAQRSQPEPERLRIEEQVATITTLKLTSLSGLRSILRGQFPGWAVESGPGYLVLARTRKHSAALVCQQALTCDEAGVAPGNVYEIWVNQGLRDATVLAVHGNQYLVEYTMPKGTTALQLFRVGERGGKSVSYRALPKLWLQAIVDGGEDWICQPQGSSFRQSAAEALSHKL